MWNAEIARKLNEWYETPSGAFALEQEHKLFQQLVSGWPRRGRTLLDVGCGTGVFLNMFWEYGFDVTGLDNSQEILAEAGQRMGNRADFRLGQLDHLPFDTGDFDYVALFSVLEYVPDPRAVLEEAMRVAGRGIVVGFMNAWSSYRLMAAFCRSASACRRNGRWLSLSLLTRMVRDICPECRVIASSVLPGPPETWKGTGLSGRLNRLPLPFPFGAYMGVRIDTEPQRPLTPLLLKARQRAMAVCSRLRPEAGRRAPASNRSPHETNAGGGALSPGPAAPASGPLPGGEGKGPAPRKTGPGLRPALMELFSRAC